ncbi:hypothetical protein GLOIN_2v1533261 [Rhizophagus irregularis DAOM 181602=DAOM 197198]|nr:hypothetical protein GLOIN_2v1533261 [Rhizophagus irregularis DAOM 181602=DAOM 197198]
MAHSRIFIIPELLEQILHFLVIDKSLYSTLFVSQLWYRCGAPILWKQVELKGNDFYRKQSFSDDYNYCKDDRSQLKKFIKLIHGKQKPVYSSNITHLEISYYHSLWDEKIIGILKSCPNIIHLSFKNSIGFSSRTLELTYPNLKYLNLESVETLTPPDLIGVAGGLAIPRSTRTNYLCVSRVDLDVKSKI